MKVFKGWLTAKDPATKTEVPFFVRTRSQDIEILNPIKLSDYLVKTSNIWKQTKEHHFIDYSRYRFDLDSDVDQSNLYVKLTSGQLEYKIYHDGTYIVNGVAVLNYATLKTTVVDDNEKTRLNYPNKAFINASYPIFRFPLPYALSEKKAVDADNHFIDTMSKTNLKRLDVYCGSDMTKRLVPALHSAYIPTIPIEPDITLRTGDDKMAHELIVNVGDIGSISLCTIKFSLEAQYKS